MTPSPVDPLAPYFDSITAIGEYPNEEQPSVDLSAVVSSDVHIYIPDEVYGYGNRGVRIVLELYYAEGVEDSTVENITIDNIPNPSFLTLDEYLPDGDSYYVTLNVAFREDWDYEAGQIHRTTLMLGDYRLPIVFEILPI